MRRQILTSSLFVAVVLVAALVFVRAQVSTSTLEDRAKVTGQYVTVLPPNVIPTYADVESLTLLSDLVVVGTAQENVCRLSPDGHSITTDFKVYVTQTLKGRLQPGSTITVKLPGGKVEFEIDSVTAAGRTLLNGRTYSAEVRTPWLKKMVAGRQYYLFLSDEVSATGGPIFTYEPVGGAQGVFGTASGIVKSNSGRLRDAMWQYHNMGESAFQLRISQAVSNPPPAPKPEPLPIIPKPCLTPNCNP